MTTFLSTLGDKLAQRLVGPALLAGLLFVAASVCAALLGQAHALDLARIAPTVTGIAKQHSTGAEVVLAVAGLLAAAAGAGVAASAAGQLTRAVWVGRWRGPAAPLARRIVAVQTRRARKAADAAGVRPVPAYLPRRPTLVGERFRLLDARIAAQYHGLRPGLVWPRLWVVLGESARAPIEAANGKWRAAAVLTGWGWLYVVLGCWWFPAGVAGVVTAALGWWQGRTHATTLVTLIEATLDTNLAAVTTALGLPCAEQGLTPETAARINDVLQKGA